ncbi:RHS repeat-associated core domain protein-containing protein [Pseudomonas sp. GM78]|uniref:RHS repeat-associated core domain-containing protein n=1 Tax=Pseudomonas sp. GM78 TaxID=1144337 RepID=UPI00027072B9|nr:RHS repeat-associated core domain-containing protein [Pseudomonas sp. GM78]EJN21695.1 RHS repeat-associated core domain protein-containing protein [Pseudomonas sp. GM78]
MTQLPPILLCQYHYDPLDRMVGHALADTDERQRFYCKSRLATETQGALRFSIIQHDDHLLAQQQREGDLIGTVLLVTAQERSVLNALKHNHQPQPANYSPYGHSRFEHGLLSLLGFNGERRDPVTGHYLLGNGYRAFNPVLMRFNSPDSWSPFGKGGLNAYAYCLGDPVNQTDPTGHGVFPKVTIGPMVPIKNQLRFRAEQLPNTIQKQIPAESISLRRLSHEKPDLEPGIIKGNAPRQGSEITHDVLNNTLNQKIDRYKESAGRLQYTFPEIMSPENVRAYIFTSISGRYGGRTVVYELLKDLIEERGGPMFGDANNHREVVRSIAFESEARKINTELYAEAKSLREKK